MGRRWVLSAIAVGAVAGLVFAIFPQWDLAIPGWFFDPVRGDFPLAIRWFPNLIRSIGHWTTLLIVLAAGGSLLAKILFPRTKALLSPRIALFLVCSFAIGPGLIVNGILKNRARVLVGIDAHAVHHVAKLLGSRYQDVFANRAKKIAPTKVV